MDDGSRSQRMPDMFANPDVPMLFIDPASGSIVDANGAAATFYGYSVEVLRTMRIDQLNMLSPEEVARRRDEAAGGASSVFPFPHRLADGSVRQVEVHSSPIETQAGVLHLTLIVDVTERVEAVAALRQREDEYRLLAENASDVVYRAGADQRTTWVSPSVQRVLGWDPSDVRGQPMSDFIHPDDIKVAAGWYTQEFAASPDVPSATFRVRTSAGEYRWMTSSTTVLRGPDDSPAGVIVGLRVVDQLVRARQRAEETSQRLQATLDSLIDPHIGLAAVRDRSGAILDFQYTDANVAACDCLGLPREEVVGRSLREVPPDSAPEGVMARFVGVVETGEPMVLDDHATGAGQAGVQRRYDMRAVRVGDSLVFSWRDVTQRSVAAEALAQSEELFRLLAENSTDVVVRIQDGEVRWVAPAIRETLGWAPADWIGNGFYDFLHPHDLFGVRMLLNEVETGAVRLGRTRMRSRSGAYHWVELHARGFVNAAHDVEGSVVSFRKIDSEVAAERELERRARTDALTGLLNRTEVMDRLETLVEQVPRTGQEIALLFCDLDRFKDVNDTHGHVVGDVLLRTVADRVLSSVRSGDIVARAGGDEIVVALAGVHDISQAVGVAEKIRARVSSPVVVPSGPTVSATVSIGVTLVRDADSIDDAVARADAAMYRAKQSGRDRVVSIEGP